MSNIRLVAPHNPAEFEAYFDLRWNVLRKPWGRPHGTEKDDQEETSIHRMVTNSEGHPVAVGRLHYNSDQQGQIRFMAVHPDYQGRGFGTKVLKELEHIAKSEKRWEIILQAREGAVRFYKNNGYAIREKSYLLFESIQHFLMFKYL